MDINRFSNSLKYISFMLSSYLAANRASWIFFSQGQYIFTISRWGTLLISDYVKNQSRWYTAANRWKKLEIMDILFKWLPMMIRFIIWDKKGLIFIFWNFLNAMKVFNKLHGLKLILWYYLSHIASILNFSHFWW